MQKIRIGVLRGGSNARGYQKSISDGAILLRAFRGNEKYVVLDILIDKEENWHIDGVPTKIERLQNNVDLVISTIEFPLKKIGYVEKSLHSLGIKCIHAPKESLRGYIDDTLLQKIKEVGVKIPSRMKLDFNDTNFATNIHKKFSPPYSLVFVNKAGVVNHLCDAVTIPDLIDFINTHDNYEQGEYYIEEYIDGDKFLVTIIPNFRGVPYYMLHPKYRDTTRSAFTKQKDTALSEDKSFANRNIHETLDLYAKLVSGTLDHKNPVTYIFKYKENSKPTLFRIIERHINNNDNLLIESLDDNAISLSEYVDLFLEGK